MNTLLALMVLFTNPHLIEGVSCGSPSWTKQIGPQDSAGNYSGWVYETIRCPLSGRGGGTKYYQQCSAVVWDANGTVLSVDDSLGFYHTGKTPESSADCFD